jgi:hypothetical protein
LLIEDLFVKREGLNPAGEDSERPLDVFVKPEILIEQTDSFCTFTPEKKVVWMVGRRRIGKN